MRKRLLNLKKIESLETKLAEERANLKVLKANAITHMVSLRVALESN
jgi:hypothetical protein